MKRLLLGASVPAMMSFLKSRNGMYMAPVVLARGASFDTCCRQLNASRHFVVLNFTLQEAYADAQQAWPK